MWESAFSGTTQPVTAALLHKAVLPPGAEPFERISAAIAVRAALRSASGAGTTLAFLVPGATPRTTLQIAAALLIGNHAHSHGLDRLPLEEARPLFTGDLLVVTPSVVETKRALEVLPIGGHQRLRDVWEVVPLTCRRTTISDKPRVLLANPGWVLSMEAGHRFGAVVVDAAHPRTLRHLPELLRTVTDRSTTSIVVAQPLPPETLASLAPPDQLSSWLWDHQAVAQAGVAVTRVPAPKLKAQDAGQKTLWVCGGDAEAAAALERLYKRLVEIAKCTGSSTYPGLQISWFVYTRLRNLAAPLAQLEDVASRSWAGTIRQRLQSLKSVGDHGTPLWDATYPALCADVDAVYSTFLKRNETAKFWALAARLEQLLKESPSAALRVVVASQNEVDLLRRLLIDVSDVVDEAIADGTLDIVTHSQDARLSADGVVCHTLLLGPRVLRFRYLDILPSTPVEVFVYPFEVALEEAAQRRLDAFITTLADTRARLAYLSTLGFRPLLAVAHPPSTPRPSLHIREAEHGHPVELATDSAAAPLLDISKFFPDADVEDDTAFPRGDGPLLDAHLASSDLAEVTFGGGATVRYPAAHRVDVYFISTGQLQRHSVASLRPGWHVISFVDGQYDSLFRRLTEVLDGRLPSKDRLALELWAAAKQGLSQMAPTKRALHTTLQSQGLGATYETFTTWFRDDDDDEGVLAPQQFDDFAVLARVSAVFPSERLLTQTFRVIQRSRGRNRASGRHLRAFLRAVVSGDGHKDALLSARTLDAALGDVLAAVEVLNVVSVRLIPRSH